MDAYSFRKESRKIKDQETTILIYNPSGIGSNCGNIIYQTLRG